MNQNAWKGHLNASITYHYSGGTFHPTLQHSNCRCLPMFMMAGLPSSLDVCVALWFCAAWAEQAPIFQGMFFPNSLRFAWPAALRCLAFGGLLWWLLVEQELCITSIQLGNNMKLRVWRYHKRKSQSGMNSGYYDHFKK